MKFTQIPSDTFQKLQLNAGILASEFVPATGEVTGLLGATTGGISFTDSLEFQDFGEDIDNAPRNTKELKKLTSHEVTMSGTFVTVDLESAQMLVGAADVSGTKVTPRNDLKDSDFADLWWIGDYSDVNTGSNAGFIAIHLLNALNTDGFQITSSDREKGQFAFNFMGHYSIDAQDTVPYELYIKEGAEGATGATGA